ncbi:hypothetical protein A8135_00820 [Legionella jamestowniensis]|uniref:Uncharacterized protein n=1 Tax=Legionella jamestowniensis TaxID=455 RepID=A0ABX2XT58_9GAMM|nr:hypothetical protein [Legionella jamestowniensis]OCH97800.1 hypothetical protein A8135_00820 [Legionella jamestowniensis]
METSHETKKNLRKDKINRIIENYLKEKFSNYNPFWLNTPENYQPLADAIDFFYDLDDENLAVAAIGSENQTTREAHQSHFAKLAALLDKFVVFSKDTPPIAQDFNAKEARLLGIQIKQNLANRSLRDLHAQTNNLGIAEKLLTEELGPSEWLNEVDLERALIKLGVKDKVHITRLNAEDIGIILHFEREKRGASLAPYSIPLLINCGNNQALGAQGTHWTEALIHVDPAAGTIRVNYRDSMHADAGVQAVLTDAVHYNATSVVGGVIKTYTAFPGVTGGNLDIRIHSDNAQLDSWSCGYRALYNLLNHPQFPPPALVTPAWTAFTTAAYESAPLRNALYHLLLGELQINEAFFRTMQLNKSAFKPLGESTSYGIEKDFTEQYIKFLSTKSASVVSSEQFAKECETIFKAFAKLQFAPEPKKIIDQLQENVGNIQKSPLSSDAKIFMLFDALKTTYGALSGARNAESELAKISKFCEEQLGVKLTKGSAYHLKKDGLFLQMAAQLGKKTTTTILPSPTTVATEPKKISLSTPVVGSPKEPAKISPSINSIDPKIDPTQPKLLAKQHLNRVGTMFNSTQFCYGNKPSGVEPGFRAIDLDNTFFEQLKKFTLPIGLDSTEVSAYKILLTTLTKIESEITGGAALKQKQIAFATFINTITPRPYDAKNPSPVIASLCEQIKEAVKENKQLSAWLYKLDYAEKGAAKERVKANKEALREYVGTHLARIFSDKNQNQTIVWLKGPQGPHALLACGWKNGLRELTDFLYGGGEPDYNGILVENPKALVKRGKPIPGLGRNLIFCLAIGDRDGIGKEGQNKGVADGYFYGFDYGKPYEGDGVCGTLRDDFSFTNPGASVPRLFRGTSPLGVARHIMYRNYSIFYDTEMSERMIGVHLLKKMITGENPSEEVMKSYPGLKHELYRIQINTPTAESLLFRLTQIRSQCKEGSPLQHLTDELLVKTSTGKLQTFDSYFTAIKIDLLEAALKTAMPNDELMTYLKLLDKWSVKAAVSNQQILNVFEQRLSLTADEINFLDKLEKVVSPTVVMSADGKAFLNQMQITKPEERIPFQLTKELNGSYTLTTTNKAVRELLASKFSLKFYITEKGLSCNFPSKALKSLMEEVERQYEEKRQNALAKPVLLLETLPNLKFSYKNETLPQLKALLTGKTPQSTGTVEYYWEAETHALSLRLTVQTEAQAKLVQEIFASAKLPVANSPIVINVPFTKLKTLQQTINTINQRELNPSALPSKSKWKQLHASKHEEGAAILEENTRSTELTQLSSRLISRFTSMNDLNPKVLSLLTNAIQEMSLTELSELMKYSEKTLRDKNNILHIINDELDQITEVDEGIELQSIGRQNVDSNLDQPDQFNI